MSFSRYGHDRVVVVEAVACLTGMGNNKIQNMHGEDSQTITKLVE